MLDLSLGLHRVALAQSGEGPPPPLFRGKKGISIMWPFMGPLIDMEPSPHYADLPFTNPVPWSEHVTPQVLADMAAAGFDHINLPVVPGPWMEALDQENADEARIAALFAMLDVAVGDILAAGLKVCIKLHATDFVLYAPADILDGTDGPTWTLYKEAARRFAVRYRGTNPAKVALSLFNEPPGTVEDWPEYLADLYAVVRAEMPNHTLCLSGDNYAGMDALVALDPSEYDERVLWVVHPYMPPIFAGQGATWSFYNKHTFGLSWPPNPDEKAAAIAAMEAQVDADDSLDAGQKTAKKAQDEEQLDFFFDAPLDAGWLDWEFNQKEGNLNAWCVTHGIPRSRIYMEEYGCTRTNNDFTATTLENRIAYLTDIRDVMETYGYRTALFALDAIDYGVTDGEGQTIGDLIPELVGLAA